MKLKRFLDFKLENMTPEEQCDQNNNNQMKQFIDKFDISDEKEFTEEANKYISLMNFSADQFKEYSITVKNSLKDRNDSLAKEYIQTLDRMVSILV